MFSDSSFYFSCYRWSGTRRLRNSSSASNHGKANTKAWIAYLWICVYDCQCVHTCRFATRPAPQDLRRVNDGDGDDWREGVDGGAKYEG